MAIDVSTLHGKNSYPRQLILNQKVTLRDVDRTGIRDVTPKTRRSSKTGNKPQTSSDQSTAKTAHSEALEFKDKPTIA
jgi:hypothetical protein